MAARIVITHLKPPLEVASHGLFLQQSISKSSQMFNALLPFPQSQPKVLAD